MSLMGNQKKLMMDLTTKGREDDFSIPGLEKQVGIMVLIVFPPKMC